MAFVRGEANFSTHGFIPIIFSNKVLAILDKTCNAFKCVNTEFEKEIEKYGDIVRVRQFGSVSVNPYTIGQDIVYQGVAENYQDLVIDQQDYWALSVDPIDIQQSDLDVLGGYADRAQVTVRNVIDSSIFSVLTSSVAASNIIGSPSNVVPLTPENVFDVFTDLFTLLFEANALPLGGDSRPFMLIPSRVHAVIKKYQAPRWTPAGDKAVMGDVGYEFADFDLLPSTNIPLTPAVAGVSSEYFPLVGGYTQATSFALQLNTMEEITPFQNKFGDAERGLILYGTKCFHPTALVKAIVSV